jgi:hypothetical protein
MVKLIKDCATAWAVVAVSLEDEGWRYVDSIFTL